MTRGRGVEGTTLIELIIVISILGMAMTFVGLALRSTHFSFEEPPEITVLREARRTALVTGKSVTVSVMIEGVHHEAIVFPDGSVVADSGFRVDRWTGRRDRER